jgi:hypothetical protein
MRPTGSRLDRPKTTSKTVSAFQRVIRQPPEEEGRDLGEVAGATVIAPAR